MAITPNTTFSSGAILTAAQMNRLPWGVMGVATRTTGNLTMTDPAADLTGMSVTFTADSTRYYRVSYSISGQKSAANGRIDFKVLNGSNTVLAINYLTLVASAYYTLNYEFYLTGITGSQTIKLNGYVTGGTASVYADGPTNSGSPYLIVQDIGQA